MASPNESVALQQEAHMLQQTHLERDVWAASIYRCLAASPMLSPSLDARLPTVPVLLHPSVPRGALPPPITARHLGFLRVDLTGESAGPGRFFPLFPAGAAEKDVGVDAGSLDRFGCTGHWASSGCIRLLTASGPMLGSSSSSSSAGGVALLPPDAFAALWERSDASAAAEHGGWHVPYSQLLPLEEVYGGLHRELKAAGFDLSRSHYMLRGWKTQEGRPRLGASAPRASSRQRARRGVVPAEIAATRDLRALINWPGLLELLEEEGVASVPTDGVRYWLARLGSGFQARLASAGVLCSETSVHHIIARSNRGIDHPLNFFLLDRGDNSALGSRVEGFRDANGVKLHMRDIVGDRAFEVAQAACNLYHGMLYAGRLHGVPVAQSLRELREGAFLMAQEAMAAQAEQRQRQAKRGSGAGGPASSQPEAEAPEQVQVQQQPQQQQGQPRGGQKRERCPGQQQQQQQCAALGEENVPQNAGEAALSPSQRQQHERRQRLDCQGWLAPTAAPDLWAVGPVAVAAVDRDANDDDGESVQAGLASMSLCCSPEGILLLGEEEAAEEQQQQQQQQGSSQAVANLSSLRARLQAALGVAGCVD